MRIVAGIYGGRKLRKPAGCEIRPTSDKIRGAIFNALQSRGVVDDAYALDAFCGSGALGLEALSQGAAHCTFIDKSSDSLALAKENADLLGVDRDQASFLVKDVTRPGPPLTKPFTLVFLDPPYKQNLLPLTLAALHKAGWIAEDAIMVLESERKAPFLLSAPFVWLDEKVYGDTKVVFARYTNTPV